MNKYDYKSFKEIFCENESTQTFPSSGCQHILQTVFDKLEKNQEYNQALLRENLSSLSLTRYISNPPAQIKYNF